MTGARLTSTVLVGIRDSRGAVGAEINRFSVHFACKYSFGCRDELIRSRLRAGAVVHVTCFRPLAQDCRWAILIEAGFEGQIPHFRRPAPPRQDMPMLGPVGQGDKMVL